MVSCTRELTKEEWDKHTEVFPSGIRKIKYADEKEVFGEALVCGYGIYGTYCFEKDGKYFVKYERGSTCD